MVLLQFGKRPPKQIYLQPRYRAGPPQSLRPQCPALARPGRPAKENLVGKRLMKQHLLGMWNITIHQLTVFYPCACVELTHKNLLFWKM